MNKSELVKNVDAGKKGIDAFFESIKNEVLKGNRVELRNFFIFYPHRYGAHIAKNPKTGEDIKVKERCRIKVKTSKHFKKAINRE